jgi:hypothetical protein
MLVILKISNKRDCSGIPRFKLHRNQVYFPTSLLDGESGRSVYGTSPYIVVSFRHGGGAGY